MLCTEYISISILIQVLLKIKLPWIRLKQFSFLLYVMFLCIVKLLIYYIPTLTYANHTIVMRKFCQVSHSFNYSIRTFLIFLIFSYFLIFILYFVVGIIVSLVDLSVLICVIDMLFYISCINPLKRKLF